MQAIVNATELVPTVNQASGDESYIIRIEMNDGTFQLVHLSMDKAVALGVQNACVESREKPQDLPASMLNYKIVQPAELNLCSKPEVDVEPKFESSLPKGRPKKRPGEQLIRVRENLFKTPKIVKTSRTRSGRITKPPTHMEQNYEKIVTDVKPSLEPITEVNTTQFEPLKTTNTITEPPPLMSLNPSPKKRNIPAQYKCPSCKKVYLGRNRMAIHFKKYPDHGAASHVMIEDCGTWYFLIETALRANKGKRGEKFCKELLNLIRNARVMAKNFLKPAKVDKTDYVVDAFLAEILNIEEGNYRFKENGICKDVNIFSFLLDDGFLETSEMSTKNVKEEQFEHSIDLPTIKPTEKFTFNIPQENKLENVEKPVIDLHFGSVITDVIDLPQTNTFENNTTSTPIKTNENKAIHQQLNKTDFMNIFNEDFIDKSTFTPAQPTEILQISTKDSLFDTNLLLPKEEDKTNESHGKEVDIFRKRLPDVLTFGTNDEQINTLLEDKEKKTVARKSDEFDLNKLHLDEFLPDAPVNNILDTSTGSDDIMNVDQFVNERFKNLTEPENDLPNTSLALDLPALECFNFNS